MDPNFPPPPEAPHLAPSASPARAGGTTTIVLQNTSLLIGLSMLAVGILVGFLLRPAIAPNSESAAPPITVVVTQIAAPVTVVNPTTNASTNATSAVSLPASPTPDLTAQKKQLMEVVLAQARHIKGNPDAKIIIIEFADFQCPFCGKFAIETNPQLQQTYVATGEAKFIYFHFPFLGEESFDSAEASECANDQGKFWEYHDKLFASQNGENQGAFAIANLKTFAKEIQLDSAAFDQCLDSGKYAQQVQTDAAFAQQLGVRSTPTFLVNGEPLLGAQPFSSFQQVISSLNLED